MFGLPTVTSLFELFFSGEGYHPVFPVDPIFLPGIISSDIDSKYFCGFHYPLFAVINLPTGTSPPPTGHAGICVGDLRSQDGFGGRPGCFCGASESLKGFWAFSIPAKHTHTPEFTAYLLNKECFLAG